MAMVARSEVVDSKYTFEYEVGIWSLGTTQVLQARDSDALKICKTVKKSLLTNPSDAVSRLRRLQGLQHTHMSNVVDVLEDQKAIYLISNKTEGNDMAEWLERTLEEGNWVQEQTCATYIRQLLIATAHSHASRVYHGELRPGSLLLTTKLPDAYVKLADFGLAPILDPSCQALRKMAATQNATAFVAPELLGGEEARITAAADMYSIGAIAHTLLVGHPPPQQVETAWGRFSTWGGDDNKAIWSERSPASEDFVQKLLRADPSERLTAAQALRHPWLRGVAAKIAAPAGGVEEGSSHRTLCYMLAVLLIPDVVEYKVFHKLRLDFADMDGDQDGLVACRRIEELLVGRGASREAAAAAVELADVTRSTVLDLCSAAVAELLVRECGDTARRAVDIAPRLLKRFFAVYGDPKRFVISIPQLRSRLCTATGRELEVKCGVDFDQVLAPFPVNAVINSQMLTTDLSDCDCRGTPLCGETDVTIGENDDDESSWGAALGLEGLDDFLGQIFQSCGRCGSGPMGGGGPSRGKAAMGLIPAMRV